MKNQTPPRKIATYESDFYLWSQTQSALIRERKFDDLDIANIAEEIESLGRGEKHEIESRLEVFLAHLLKWQFQPEKRTRSWRLTLKVQRRKLARVLDENPSLYDYPNQEIESAFLAARLSAENETGLAFEVFPEICPLTMAQIMDEAFPS